MKPYSLDLRTRIVQAVADGMSKAEAARTFVVNVHTVYRYVAAQTQQQSLAPRSLPGGPRRIRPDQEAALLAQIAAAPDTPLTEHSQQWAARVGTPLSASTLSRFLARQGWTRKKKVWLPPSGMQTNGLRSVTSKVTSR